MPFGIRDYHRDLASLHVGCEEPHAYFIPYADEGAAGEDVRDRSPYFKSLLGAWDFHFYPSVTEVPDPRTGEVEYREQMNVPSSWQFTLGRGYDVPHYTNVAYPIPLTPPLPPEVNPAALYRRSFTLTADFIRDKELMLTFEGVDSCFYLFVNRTFVGYSQVSHMTSEFNVTELVHPGENEVTVLVVKWCDGTYLEDQDKFRSSGIFREVYVLARDKERISDVFVRPTLSDDLGTGRLCVELKTVGRCAVGYTLRDREGRALATGEKTLSGEGAIEVGELVGPNLWSDESPYLYTLTLRSGGEVIAIPVGFRRIEIVGRVVYINGKKVKVKGANRHDGHPVLGSATPFEHMKRDLLIMKQNNMNMVRTSHYPNDPRFPALCDRYGVYMCDETDLECHGVPNIHCDHPMLTDDPVWREAYLDRVRRMLERDKNHPAVIIWSVGNESGPGANHEAMARYLRERDGSRILLVDDESRRTLAVREERRQGNFNNVDPEHYTAYYDIDSWMYASPRQIEYRNLLADDMKKPFFLCEYCHAMGNGPGDIGTYVELMYRYDSFFGGCVWELFDHAVATGECRYAAPQFIYGGDSGEEPHDGNFCVDGLLYPDRRLHTGMLEVRQAYKPFAASYENGILTVKSRRCFESLGDLTLYYTVERNGRVAESGTLGPMNIRPGAAKRYKLPIEATGYTTLNISARRNAACAWGEIGDEVGSAQFILSEEIPSQEKMGGATLRTDPEGYTVSFDETVVRIGRESGLIESIVSEGRSLITAPVIPTLWRAPTDNDRYVKERWLAAALDRLVPTGRVTGAEERPDCVCITAAVALAAPGREPAVSMRLTYTLAAGLGIRVTCEAEVGADTPTLPRFGFRFRMPEDTENVRYFGYGPYEAYEDKRLASRMGLFTTTATGNFEHYIRPQENCAHYGCRFADVTTVYGQGLYFSAAGFSLSASHYTPEQLTVTPHDYELTPDRETTVIVDYRNAGIGSNSCGPELDPAYRISEKSIRFRFTVKPCFAGNISPFDAYTA